MYDVLIVGCGLAGMTVARELADNGYKILIIEKRNHISGNIYDKIDEDGFLVQIYGPHCFFTNNGEIKSFVEKYIAVDDCFVKCRTVINRKKLPMPFNFTSIDLIYDEERASKLKKKLVDEYNKEIVSVTDLLESKDEEIRDFGVYLYKNEYTLYSSKQWGLDISQISPEVFKRVPVYLSYRDMYQSHKYQFLPRGGFTKFATSLLDSKNIEIRLGVDALREGIVRVVDNDIICNIDGIECNIPVLFTGELDALMKYKYGILPYRSLEFVWKHLDVDSYQETEIVAYPQADKITRVTEYKKLPRQEKKGETKISIEFPVPYTPGQPIGTEPYYPIKNNENDALYLKYLKEASKISNLFLCGRLADYKYYNMDEVIVRAWNVSEKIKKYFCDKNL